jgi:internalin A
VPPEVFDLTAHLEADEKFWECTELQKLDLSHNDIHTLPEGWSSLTSLLTLTVKGNKLGAAALPADLLALPALTVLDLSSNALKSTSLSDAIAGLAGTLISLDLSCNQISQLPAAIAQLTRLEVLNVSVSQCGAKYCDLCVCTTRNVLQ